MPVLDVCIASTYEPGNIGASSGQTPIVRVVPPAVPTITSAASVSVDEGETLAHSLTADKFVSWAIIGGADQAQFEISVDVLRWASDGTQDYEAPADADVDNDYLVTVRATDVSLNTADQVITVTVDDVSETVSRQAMLPGSYINSTGGRQIMTPDGLIHEN